MSDTRFTVCPLCGFEFEPVDTLCQHGCPLRTVCGLIRCPACEYEFPERPRPVSWLRRLLGRSAQASGDPCGRFLTLADLASGSRAEVVSLSGRIGSRNTLTVFGIAPGGEITLLQRRPEYVVRVGESELALESAIAREIVVRLPAAEDGPAPDRPTAGRA